MIYPLFATLSYQKNLIYQTILILITKNTTQNFKERKKSSSTSPSYHYLGYYTSLTVSYRNKRIQQYVDFNKDIPHVYSTFIINTSTTIGHLSTSTVIMIQKNFKLNKIRVINKYKLDCSLFLTDFLSKIVTQHNVEFKNLKNN